MLNTTKPVSEVGRNKRSAFRRMTRYRVVQCASLIAPYGLIRGSMRRHSARQKLSKRPLSGELIYKVMRSIFPKRNDYGTASFDELVPELACFGIDTVGKLRALMTKHRRQLLQIDRDPLAPWEKRYFTEQFDGQ